MPNQKTTADTKRGPVHPRNLTPSPAKTAAVKGGKKKPIVLDTSSIPGESMDAK